METDTGAINPSRNYNPSSSSGISESAREAMLEEDFLDMTVDGEEICMGDGAIRLSDPNNKTDGEPKLEIIAIGGIVSRS